MTRGTIVVALVAAALGSADAARAADWPRGSWPDWAELRDVDALHAEPDWEAHERQQAARGGFHSLLVDKFIRHEEDGREARVVREVLIMHSGQGLEQAGDFMVTYLPEEDEVELLHLRRRHGWNGEWEAVAFETRLDSAGKVEGAYVDEETVAFIPDGLRPGDHVDFAYQVRGKRDPVPWDWWLTDDSLAHTCTRRLVVDAPLSMELGYYTHGFDPPTLAVHGGRRRLVWDGAHIDSAVIEQWLPDDFEPKRTLLIHTATAWAELAADYAALLDAIPVAPETGALARQILADGAEPITALAGWVQRRIRYVAIEVSTHRLVPSPPPVTLARGYGDCKDMSLLLVHLLRSAGYAAWPAMVRTPQLGPVHPEAPMLSVFDHEIVAVERGGELLFIDPTVKEAVPPWSGALRPGARALVAEPRYALVEVGEQPDALDSVHSLARTSATTCPDGGPGCLLLEVETRYAGPALTAERNRMLFESPEQLRRSATDFYGRAVADRSLLTLTEDYSEAHNGLTPLVIKERFVYGARVPDTGFSFWYMPPEIAVWFDHPEVAERRSPYGLSPPREAVVELLHQDAEAAPAEPPGPWIHDDGFVRISRRSERTDEGIRTIWRATTLADQVPLAELAGFAAGLDRSATKAAFTLSDHDGLLPGADDGWQRWVLPVVSGLWGVIVGLILGFLLFRRRRR